MININPGIKFTIEYIHSTFGNLQYVSGNWKKSVKWNVVTVPHYIQKDIVSCGVLTINVRTHEEITSYMLHDSIIAHALYTFIVW